MSILKILKEFKSNKAIGVDNLAGRFLKDDSNILCTPIAKICNLSSNSRLSQINVISQRLSLCIKKLSKLTQRTLAPSCCFHLSLRLFGELFMIKLWTFYQITMSYTNINQVLGNFTQQTLVCHTPMTKPLKISILVSQPEWFFLIYKRRSIQLTTTF